MRFIQQCTKYVKKKLATLPRAFFRTSRTLGLSVQELDLVLKLLAFNLSGEMRPVILALAARAGYSVRTLERAAEELERKGLLKKTRLRNADGTFWANSYDLTGLYAAVAALVPESNQLSLFSEGDLDASGKGELEEWNPRAVSRRFGAYGEKVLEWGFAYVPRALDEFQKDLGMDAYHSVFVKYCLSYVDEKGVCEISLTKFRDEVSVSKWTTAKIVKELAEMGLVGVMEQTTFRRRKSNRYDISPLVRKIEAMEKARSASPAKRRKPSTSAVRKKPETDVRRPDAAAEIRNRIGAMRSEWYVPKNSERAAEIRCLESELSETVSGKRTFASVSDLVRERMRAMAGNPAEREAERMCRKLRGNWERNRAFYMKAVRELPNSSARLCAAAAELGKAPERYFMRSVSNELAALAGKKKLNR